MKNNDEMVEFLSKDVKESFKQGSKGPAIDAVLQYRDWGIDLTQVTIPVHLYHGASDKFVPVIFAEELHRTLPNSTLKKYPNQGHYSMMKKLEDVFQDIDKYTIGET